jgi:hypothetical protein
MKRIAILEGLALALVLMAVEGAAAACVATNCAIDEQPAPTPAPCVATNCTIDKQRPTDTERATAPKLENALKDLGNLTQHALTQPCSGPGCKTTLEPTKSAPPATCPGNKC